MGRTRVLRSRAPALRRAPKRRLELTLEQHPLLWREHRVAGAWRGRPRVFVGVGLCAQDGVSAAVPFDLLGLLLPAEAVRRAVGGAALTVLIADAHARAVGMPRDEVDAQVTRVERALQALRRLPALAHLQLTRASDLHRQDAWRTAYRRVCRALPDDASPYLCQQLADVEVMRRERALIKVGWAIGADGDGRHDERAFDAAFRETVGGGVSFVYARPGRRLHPTHYRAVPYVTTAPGQRLCLRPDEPVAQKWRATGDFHPTVGGGVRRHVKAITRAFAQDVLRLTGPMDERLQQITDALFPAPRSLLEVRS